ncbi:MAG: tRNA 2-thiocytidine(32) synthetase TtcA [Vicinamibacterales bacterium]
MYRTDLEAQLAKKTTRAIVDHGLIEEGDRVMVGLSGGKDSWSLLQILHVLRRRAPIDFDIFAVTVDAGFQGFDHQAIARACAERGWRCRVETTRISAVMNDLLEPGDTPCSLCARLRRGALYRLATEEGATKIALGHHADDVIETLLMNLFFGGSLKAMPARLLSDDGAHVVVRPLVYVFEQETAAYAEQMRLPIQASCCTSCRDMAVERRRTKQLVADLEMERPGIRRSMLTAVSNVVPSHLLDRSLRRIGTE